jgi:hypothetical protein
MTRPGAYGWAWSERRGTTPFIDGTPCHRCGQPIRAWQTRDLDHLLPVYLYHGAGPVAWAHARCNRQAGGRAGAAITNRKRAARRVAGLPDTKRQGLRRSSPPSARKPGLTPEQRARRDKWG